LNEASELNQWQRCQHHHHSISFSLEDYCFSYLELIINV
jgi:hypothetical protein